MFRHPLARMITLGLVASAIGTWLVLKLEWFPQQGSAEASDIDHLYDVSLVFSVPIFVLVMTVAIYSVVRFRARPGDTGDGAPIHGNTRLEIFWVTIPFLIVSGLAAYAWVVLDDIEAKKPGAMTVNVTGQQFAWSFDYPTRGGGKPITTTDPVLPQGRQVEFKIQAKDVIHSFWVPAFRMKQDAVPGIVTRTRLTPSRLGRYDVVCAELCGIGHSTMRQSVQVVPQQEFDSWLKRQRQRAGGGGEAEPGQEAAGTQGQAAAGRQLFIAQGCNACHTLTDADATATVGPDLDELAKVATDRDPDVTPKEYVRQSIVDPRAFVVKGFPAGTMPEDFDEKLSRQEIDALVDYLLEVSEGSGGKAK